MPCAFGTPVSGSIVPPARADRVVTSTVSATRVVTSVSVTPAATACTPPTGANAASITAAVTPWCTITVRNVPNRPMAMADATRITETGTTPITPSPSPLNTANALTTETT